MDQGTLRPLTLHVPYSGCENCRSQLEAHSFSNKPVPTTDGRWNALSCCVVVAGTDLRLSVWLCQYPARIKCPLHISLCIHHGGYDSSTQVRRRHLAGADAKDRYAIIRLVGMAGSIKSRHRGFCFSAPISPPLLFSAQTEKIAFNAVGFRHVRSGIFGRGAKVVMSPCP